MRDADAAIFAAEIGDAVSIDLHGLDVATATHELDEFLHREFMRRTEVVKIIHGRGEQKLQRTVESHLRKQPFVTYFRGSHSPTQQGAVTYAVLARTVGR